MRKAEIIEVRKERERIKIFFPNPDHIAKIKTIGGYKWHAEGKYWSIPYSELERLLSVFDGEKTRCRSISMARWA